MIAARTLVIASAEAAHGAGRTLVDACTEDPDRADNETNNAPITEHRVHHSSLVYQHQGVAVVVREVTARCVDSAAIIGEYDTRRQSRGLLTPSVTWRLPGHVFFGSARDSRCSLHGDGPKERNSPLNSASRLCGVLKLAV